MDLTTETLARRLGLQPQSLRAAICRTGSYYGIIPAKLPNGRLLWPADAFERLILASSRIQGALTASGIDP